jgi:hypothetical protein
MIFSLLFLLRKHSLRRLSLTPPQLALSTNLCAIISPPSSPLTSFATPSQQRRTNQARHRHHTPRNHTPLRTARVGTHIRILRGRNRARRRLRRAVRDIRIDPRAGGARGRHGARLRGDHLDGDRRGRYDGDVGPRDLR